MRRLATSVVGIAAAILFASVVSANGSSSPAGTTTMTVVQKQTSFKVVGNTVVTTDDVFSYGRKIGRDQTACIVIGAGAPGFLECWASHTFRGGQIESQAAVNPTVRGFTAAVTGGTGRYSGARGTLGSAAPVSATQKTVVFHLIG